MPSNLFLPTLLTIGPSPRERSGSLDQSFLVIPTFTVTINPLEDNEITFVPESPGSSNPNAKKIGGGHTNDNW